MKVLFTVGVVMIVAIISAGLGFSAGLAANISAKLRELGFSRKSRTIYKDAITVLNRMIRITELHGDFSPDILSAETRKQIEDVLKRYENEVSQS